MQSGAPTSLIFGLRMALYTLIALWILFARKIIAWSLSDNMEVSSVIETINKAKACRDTNLPLIIHSDRGSQYVSNAWCVPTQNMQRSYSHTGYPHDNACIESFHSLIRGNGLIVSTFRITNMLTDLYLNILKHFTILLRFIATAIICPLTTMKNCMKG